MAVNKVIYGGNTLVDLTGDTVTAADLADGVKATGADGNPVIGLMQKVTIDAELSTTSTNPVQNKVIKEALDTKLGKNETAARATQDGAGNTISTTYAKQSYVSALLSTKLGVNSTAYAATRDDAGNIIANTYAKKTDISGFVKTVNGTKPDTNGNVAITVSGGSNVTVDTSLSATSTNAIANKAVYTALQSKLGKTETAYAATKATQDGDGNTISSTYIKFINGNGPDASGNVNVNAGGGGVSTSVTNTWTAQQNFHDLMLYREKYTTYVVNGTSYTPTTSTMFFTPTGAFTLNLVTLAGALSAGQSSIFTAYFAANADYPLTITNAGTLNYVGSASGVAITSAGLLLNIMMLRDTNGNLTSIVQASKLS